MTTKRKKGLTISLFLLLLAGAAVLNWIWNNPPFGRPLPIQSLIAGESTPASTLAETVPTPELTASPEAEAALPAESATEVPSAHESPRAEEGQALPSSEPAIEQARCSAADVMTVAVLGLDENEQTDAIRLMRLDFAQERVSVVSIPRDFWVPIVDMQEHGIEYGRINATYGYGEYFNGDGGGIESFGKNMQANFGVSFDHYLVLHFTDIEKYIDLIGGVDVTLDQPVFDRERQFSAGEHHFDGETAVLFMRMREGDSDFYRVRRQSLILTAFYKKVMHELNLWQQVKLAVTIISDRSIQTDFSAKDAYALACLAGRIDSADVAFIEIPSSLYHPMTTNRGASVIIPHEGVAGFLQSVMDGSYAGGE